MVVPIGFFAPLPLPMMIPFMGIQSAVMAEQFGTLFQYGKRRISAMSNEEFNKLTFEDLQDKMNRQIMELTKVGGTMEQQIKAMRPMVGIIIAEFAEYIKSAILAVPEIAGGVGLDLSHLEHGHLPHQEPLPPPPGATPISEPIPPYTAPIGPQPQDCTSVQTEAQRLFDRNTQTWLAYEREKQLGNTSGATTGYKIDQKFQIWRNAQINLENYINDPKNADCLSPEKFSPVWNPIS